MDRAPGRTPRRGRPPTLDRDKLVTAAARMSPETLTMAAVAAELGVSTSALYRWVADREALLDLVSTTMAARTLPGGPPEPADWRDWLIGWAHNVRREFGAVPGFAVRVLTGPHRAAGHDPLEQAGVRAFTAAGLDPARARQCWYAFGIAVLGWTAAEHGGGLFGEAPGDFDALLDILIDGSVPAGRAQ
jgi:AcrR family transcriptional regulator